MEQCPGQHSRGQRIHCPTATLGSCYSPKRAFCNRQHVITAPRTGSRPALEAKELLTTSPPQIRITCWACKHGVIWWDIAPTKTRVNHTPWQITESACWMLYVDAGSVDWKLSSKKPAKLHTNSHAGLFLMAHKVSEQSVQEHKPLSLVQTPRSSCVIQSN